MEHAVSLHLNTAKIGFLKSGEQRNGPFNDAGQREKVGCQLLKAVSDFYSRRILGLEPASAQKTHKAFSRQQWETLLISEAAEAVQGMTNFFMVSSCITPM